MLKLLVIFLGLVLLVAAKPALFEDADPSKIHAVLVSGVEDPSQNTFGTNYALEVEVARTYHWLVDHGVLAENIILFMNGKFVNYTENPKPNTLYADKDLSRNYAEGLQIDYSDKDVTPENFLAVIQGESDKLKGIGSGRVLKSTEKNRVFISHESHGDSGVLALGNSWLTVQDLNNALKNMEKKKMFFELLYYVVACHSGSMFSGQLNKDGKIYAFTASSPNRNASTLPCSMSVVGEKEIRICRGTQFGKAWLDNVEEKNTKEETLDQQYKIVVSQVKSKDDSQRYGNMKIGKEPVANFEGVNTNTSTKSTINNRFASGQNDEDSIPISPIASYLLLKRKLKNSKKFAEQKELKEQLTLTGKSTNFKEFSKPPSQIMQLDCHSNVVKAIWNECKKIKKSPFVYEFITPVVNLCEQRYPADKIVEQIKKQCS
ncbi:Legumain [Aphelenchoides bicaudatus]|nr:Legumain [Aphelenchoides bicaudatus]